GSSRLRRARRAPRPRGRRSARRRGRTRGAERRERDRAGPSGNELEGEQEHGAEADEERADRQRGIEVDLELGVDGERESLRDPLEAAGEEQRGPELAQPSGQGQCRGSAESGGGERERDTREDAKRSSA